MHPGPDGGHRRRPEGADRRGRRLPGERAVVEGAALGRARPGAWRSTRAWPSATGRWASGRRCGRSGRRPGSNAAGSTRRPTCWTSCPRGQQPKAKAMLHDIWQAETKAEAEKAFDLFVATYEAKYPKATECLVKDREELLVFYDFPAEHWLHMRTTNPIESTFATVRLRHEQDQGERLPGGVPDDGVQADGERIKELACLERITPPSGRHLRGEVRRWDRGQGRRLNHPRQRHLTIALGRGGAPGAPPRRTARARRLDPR